MGAWLRKCAICRRRIFREPWRLRGHPVHGYCAAIIDPALPETYRHLLAAHYGLQPVTTDGAGGTR